MRAQDNGHLTKQDRQTLDKQQNQESQPHLPRQAQRADTLQLTP